ncbi:hypothetical protein [Roseomonas genomospecies 6]|nr:hypothetical protein [Roseomonas genomospecies 6]
MSTSRTPSTTMGMAARAARTMPTTMQVTATGTVLAAIIPR